MVVKTMKMRVHLQNLMKMAVEGGKAPGLVMGFQIAEQCLIRIAKRAVELKDEEILEELDTLCIVKETE